MKSIYNFLSSKTAAWLFTIIAIACRVAGILYASFTSRDKIFLALQSKSLLNGKGLSIPEYYIANPASPVYDLTPVWPPGYPFLLAPFLKIFNYDVAAATAAIDLLGAITIIFLVRKIAVLLKFPAAAVNIITLITGCFEYPFISEALPTDIPALAFFLAGLMIFLKSLQNEKPGTQQLIIASLLLFIPCTFRYSYPPLSIAVPFAVIFGGWYLNKKIFIKKGGLSLAILSLFLLIFFISLKTITGNTGYIVDTGKGFYPGNLLHCAPIVPGSFINTFFTTSQLTDKIGLSFPQSFLLLEIINGVMIAGLLILAFYLHFRKKIFSQSDAFNWFLLVGFFISAATFVSLGYLSLIYKPQPGYGYGWNYLNEPRYFMFVNIFLQVSFIGWIFLYPSWKKNIVEKIIVSVLSLLLFIEVLHNIYFYSKVVVNPAGYQTAPYEEPDYTFFTYTTQSLHRENPDADILVIAGSDDFYPLMAAYLDHKGIKDGHNILKEMPVLKKRTILIFALYEDELNDYNSFLTDHKGELLNRINGINFYRVDLNP